LDFLSGRFAAGSTLALDTTNAGGSFSYAGNIGSPLGLTKLGSGTLVLSGTNSYSGATTIGGGTLQFAKAAAFYNGTIDAPRGETLGRFRNHGCFQHWGRGEFTSGHLDTLRASSGFASGSFLGLDTTNAVGAFTYASNIGGAIGSRKLGAGSLVLNGTNSYLGATVISGGMLQFSKTSAFYNGVIDPTTAAKVAVGNGATVAFNVGGPGEFTAGISTPCAPAAASRVSSPSGSTRPTPAARSPTPAVLTVISTS